MACTPRLWAGVGQWSTGGPFAGRVNALAVDPDTAAIAYAAVSDNLAGSSRLFKTVNAGVAWATSGLDSQAVSALATGPRGLVYAGTRPGGSSTQGGAVYKSVDGGATWAQVVPAANALATTILRIDAVTPSSVYRAIAGTITNVGPPPGSLSRTDDSGATWTELGSLNYQAPRALALDPKRSGVLYLAVDSGLYRSTDFGTNWSLLGTGLDGSTVSAVVIDPVDTSNIYAGTTRGVFKSTDGGVSFAPAGGGFGSFVSDLVVEPTRSGRLYAGTVSNGVFATSDGGSTWVPFNSGLADLSIFVLGLDRTGAFLHAGAGTGVFEYQLGTDPGVLTLNASHKFEVRLTARDPRTGRVAAGLAFPVNDFFGYFSLPDITFEPGNPEVFVKILDGTSVNGKFWVFYGGLTDLEYTLTVTERATGKTKTYTKPAGSAAGGFDTSAFP